jgi:ATP-dependent RNA helicase DDX19/DBP5
MERERETTARMFPSRWHRPSPFSSSRSSAPVLTRPHPSSPVPTRPHPSSPVLTRPHPSRVDPNVTVQSWADQVEQLDQSGGGGSEEDAPPGFEHQKPAASGLTDLTAAVANVGVSDAESKPAAPVKVESSMYSSAATFEELGLSKELLQGLYTEMKFERPSQIQAKTLPMVLKPPYTSLIAQGHNGSGKTTCFTLAMLSRVDPALKAPQALCLCPTRELVVQNLGVLEKMGTYTGISLASTAELTTPGNRRRSVSEQVIVGTHGKLKDWISRRVLNIKSMKILVFDEADEMLKQDGFADDSVRLIKQLKQASPELQILLFSATFNEQVKRFAQKIVPGANHVFIDKEDLSLDVIKQYKVVCPNPLSKTTVLKEMIFPQCEKLGQTIIFVRERQTARALHAAMEQDGHKCTSIEGGMDKEARDRVVREFRDGTTKILISTDVLSRGFDVTQVTLVVNYDVPTERDVSIPAYETYLHRIGRSGRFGRKGAAFNLVTGEAENRILNQIADYFKHEIPEVPWDNDEKFEEVLRSAGLTT